VTTEQENEASGQEHQELEATGLFARVMRYVGHALCWSSSPQSSIPPDPETATQHPNGP
jgi:Tfp pilus assembly protein PilW